MTLSVQMLGDDRFVRAFSRVGDEIEDFSEVFGQIYADFTEIEQRIFAAEGPGWVSLSPKYAAWKELHFPGMPILQATGRLKGSLAGDAGEGMNEYAIRDVHPRDAYFGTTLPYAAAHQYGTGVMPARPPVRVGDEDKNRWAYMVHKWIVGKMRDVTAEGGNPSA